MSCVVRGVGERVRRILECIRDRATLATARTPSLLLLDVSGLRERLE